ncbi:uncharacterized protein LOC100863535 isoform X3 [Apis florea]|uniref:uncharacterized protein LOC100863535 isoform X3 n=1 Tax=Apis florea TaxID=7463 RepID=UPI0012FEBED6|nr:uncharacterized protein LOC100863535 isoform X3 [Apis florea]
MSVMSRGSPWCWDAPGTRKSMLFLTIAILFGLLSRGVVGEKNKKYHISDVCKKNYMRDLYRKIDGAVLQSQLEKDLDCTITFQTHSILQRFMLRFDHLQLDCNDHLYIYDGAHAVSSYKADLSCQNTKQTVGAIYTRTNFVTLKYVTDSWGTLSNGFRLVITAVKDPKHTCKDFRCTQNEFCIERDLLCDGVNHCGDESDEATSTLCANSEASTILGMQTIWFVIGLVFLILSVAGLVTAAVLCFCRQRAATPRHPHNAHNAQTHPPVSFPLQQMYGSNGASAGLPMGMTTLKSGGALGSLGTYGSALGSGVTGATTLPRPGNWLRPAGLRHGHSAARVRLYCQAK